MDILSLSVTGAQTRMPLCNSLLIISLVLTSLKAERYTITVFALSKIPEEKSAENTLALFSLISSLVSCFLLKAAYQSPLLFDQDGLGYIARVDTEPSWMRLTWSPMIAPHWMQTNGSSTDGLSLTVFLTIHRY